MPIGIYKHYNHQGFQKGHKLSKGRKLSKETREKISNTHKKIGVGKWNKNRKLSIDTKNKIREALKGEKASNWKGGITDYNRKLYLNRRYKDLRRGSYGFYTQGEWELLKAQYNWTCPSCSKKEPIIILTIDHIIPVSKGGSSNIENIQPLCKSCNCKKHTKIIKYREG